MKRYIYSSELFEGEIEFRYNDDGILCFFEVRAEVEQIRLATILHYMPHCADDVPSFTKKGTGTMTEVPEEITFDMFWNQYAKKVNRFRSEKLWKHMNEAEQLQAVKSIKPYNRCIERTNRFKQDPDTYLRNKSYQTNWNLIG
jgi:hypothetical protein